LKVENLKTLKVGNIYVHSTPLYTSERLITSETLLLLLKINPNGFFTHVTYLALDSNQTVKVAYSPNNLLDLVMVFEGENIPDPEKSLG
jgi:hypothetical protein